jgi:hypothetical protein
MSKATILIIDDSESQSALQQHLTSTKLVTAETIHPNDVSLDDLRRSDLVLVDYQLDEWPEKNEIEQISLKPPDGLALSSILRRYSIEYEKDSPTAIAILTGKIDKLASPLPYENREHALAHLNNLEWVFQKAKPGEESRLAVQLTDLAEAVTKLPPKWSSEESHPLSQLATLLGVDSEDSVNERLIEDVEGCSPPIHELSEWSHGLAVLRWLLHRVLPYPCFLWDTHYLAARLTLDHEALVTALAQDKRLNKVLTPALYEGVLSKFLGARWWRSRVELLLWEITEGQSADPMVVRDRINEITKLDLPASQPSVHPVVCVNSNYQALNKFYPMKESVRIRPDDWPPYADQAWTTIELAKSEPKLRSIVLTEDVGRLKS